MGPTTGGSGQIGKAPVSKTGDSRFESWLPRLTPAATKRGSALLVLREMLARPHIPLAAIACALLTVALLALSPAPAAALETDCPKAKATPAQATPAQLKRAMRCLLREVRTKRNSGKVKAHPDLTRIARRHTKVMLRKNCLRHRCRGEAPLDQRLEASGYLRPGQRYGYAEAIGFSTTPLAMMGTWLNPRNGVRKNILGRRFTHVGIGVGKGAARRGKPDSRYATYTVLLAWRRG